MIANDIDLQWVRLGSAAHVALERQGYHAIRTKEQHGQALVLMASGGYVPPEQDRS